MPNTIKTAISLDQRLFKAGEVVAKELNVSRSRLFSMALEEFIRRRRNRKLLDEINAAYTDEPDQEEQVLRKQMRRHHKGLLERES
jgi:metal-responsive CopG/Arc/MetJ family transcriptional regulator